MVRFVSIECVDVGEAIGLNQELGSAGYDAQFLSGLVGRPTVLVRRPFRRRPGPFTAEVRTAVERWLADGSPPAALVVDGETLRIEGPATPGAANRPSAAAAPA